VGQRQFRATNRRGKLKGREERHNMGCLVRQSTLALSPAGGPQDTSTFYQHWREDIALLKALNHNSFRTSISWSRLIPDGIGEVNREAVAFYSTMLSELAEQGIEPFITLFHFDMPMVMQEKGGWENREVVEAFSRYAQICFDLFGHQVKHWFTFNEPIVPVEGGYLYDFHYPNVVDFKRAATVAYNTVLAHASAVRAFRAGHHSGEIGIVLNLTPSYPRSQHPADLKAAHHADLLFNRSFLDPVLRGEYPADLVALLKEYDQLPACHLGDKELIAAGKVDLLGINYYQPRRVKCRDSAVNPESPFMPEWLFDYYEMPGRKMNPGAAGKFMSRVFTIFWLIFVIITATHAALFLKMVWVSKMNSVLLKTGK
jgi:6-phospho-beta-glucosidase